MVVVDDVDRVFVRTLQRHELVIVAHEERIGVAQEERVEPYSAEHA